MAKEIVLINTTAHLKHIALRDGEVITIPPTDSGTKVGIENDKEMDRLRAALETPACKAWISAGELVVAGMDIQGVNAEQRSVNAEQPRSKR